MVENLKEFLEGQGYEEVKNIDGWGWCGLNRFLFTYGVIYGMNELMYKGRYCFDTKGNAMAFYKDMIKHGPSVDLPIIGEDGCTAIK